MQADGDGPGGDTLLVQLMKRVSPCVKASVWGCVQTPSGSASAVYLWKGWGGFQRNIKERFVMGESLLQSPETLMQK